MNDTTEFVFLPLSNAAHTTSQWSNEEGIREDQPPSISLTVSRVKLIKNSIYFRQFFLYQRESVAPSIQAKQHQHERVRVTYPYPEALRCLLLVVEREDQNAFLALQRRCREQLQRIMNEEDTERAGYIMDKDGAVGRPSSSSSGAFSRSEGNRKSVGPNEIVPVMRLLRRKKRLDTSCASSSLSSSMRSDAVISPGPDVSTPTVAVDAPAAEPPAVRETAEEEPAPPPPTNEPPHRLEDVLRRDPRSVETQRYTDPITPDPQSSPMSSRAASPTSPLPPPPHEAMVLLALFCCSKALHLTWNAELSARTLVPRFLTKEIIFPALSVCFFFMRAPPRDGCSPICAGLAHLSKHCFTYLREHPELQKHASQDEWGRLCEAYPELQEFLTLADRAESGRRSTAITEQRRMRQRDLSRGGEVSWEEAWGEEGSTGVGGAAGWQGGNSQGVTASSQEPYLWRSHFTLERFDTLLLEGGTEMKAIGPGGGSLNATPLSKPPLAPPTEATRTSMPPSVESTYPPPYSRPHHSHRRHRTPTPPMSPSSVPPFSTPHTIEVPIAGVPAPPTIYREPEGYRERGLTTSPSPTSRAALSPPAASAAAAGNHKSRSSGRGADELPDAPDQRGEDKEPRAILKSKGPKRHPVEQRETLAPPQMPMMAAASPPISPILPLAQPCKKMNRLHLDREEETDTNLERMEKTPPSLSTPVPEETYVSPTVGPRCTTTATATPVTGQFQSIKNTEAALPITMTTTSTTTDTCTTDGTAPPAAAAAAAAPSISEVSISLVGSIPPGWDHIPSQNEVDSAIQQRRAAIARLKALRNDQAAQHQRRLQETYQLHVEQTQQAVAAAEAKTTAYEQMAQQTAALSETVEQRLRAVEAESALHAQEEWSNRQCTEAAQATDEELAALLSFLLTQQGRQRPGSTAVYATPPTSWLRECLGDFISVQDQAALTLEEDMEGTIRQQHELQRELEELRGAILN